VNKTLDFVCLHGYYGDPTNKCWYATLDHTRELTRKYMGREVPIWVTGFNVHSSDLLLTFFENGHILVTMESGGVL